MQHCGYVVKIEHLRKHENADRLQIATFFGSDTVVDLNTHLGDVGVYFPSDLQLSEEFCEVNNLVRKKDENGKEVGGYLDPEKRNIRPIKLRGEKSDGVYIPLRAFDYCFEGSSSAEKELHVGDLITVVNGHEICKKYIPKIQIKAHSPNVSKGRKRREKYSPLFAEHIDTEQLARNLSAFRVGDEIDLTLKMHGTSQRTAYLPVFKGYNSTNFLHNLILKLVNPDKKINKVQAWLYDTALKSATPTYEYDYVCGTRRVVLEDFTDGGYYGKNDFRMKQHEQFVGKLMKGETVYYEVVGFTDSGAPIMPNGNNKIVDKDFVKQYGPETVFSYGCVPQPGLEVEPEDDAVTQEFSDAPQTDMYVYRMTLTTDEGYVVEYTPDLVRYRCEQMGIKCVPYFGKGILSENCLHFVTSEGKHVDYVTSEGTIGDIIMKLAEEYCSGPDPVGKTHTREGVVVRIINRPSVKVLKHKCYEFKMLEGIIKETASAPDMEEAQDVEDITE